MDIVERCILGLDSRKLFHDRAHRSRFKEFMDVFSSKPFFSNKICKCMYLSAWDDEHFLVLLEMLNAMAFGTGTDTTDMTQEGTVLSEESDVAQQPVYELSVAFMADTPFVLKNPESVPEETKKIITMAIKAADVIDEVMGVYIGRS